MCKNFETTFNIAVLGMMKEFKETTTGQWERRQTKEQWLHVYVRYIILGMFKISLPYTITEQREMQSDNH